jgi:hypothetical protein
MKCEKHNDIKNCQKINLLFRINCNYFALLHKFIQNSLIYATFISKIIKRNNIFSDYDNIVCTYVDSTSIPWANCSLH